VEEVSVASELAVIVDALVTNVLLPALRVRELDPPDEIVPAPAKPIAVADTDIVSIEATPVNAPVVETFKPVDVNSNVPVALPIVVFDPAAEESVVSPHDVRSVNIAVPGDDVPIDARFAAPVADIFQLASVRETLAAALPRVRSPEYDPVPILTADDPEVLILVVPAIVAPPVAVNNPPKVILSQSVAVLRVDVALFLDQ